MMAVPPRRWVPPLLLLLVAAGFYAWNLGAGSLRTWDEGLSAIRSLEMLRSGQWVTPTFGGVPDFNKPPLYYWLTAATMAVLGPTELAVRLWSAVAGLCCIALVGLHARRATRSDVAGLLAAMLLLASPHWMNRTREGLLDSMMLALMLGAWYLLAENPGKRSVMLAGVLAGLSILAKGPLVLLALVMIPAGREGNWRSRLGPVAMAAGVMLAVAAPWFILQYVRWGDRYVEQYVRYNFIARVGAGVEGHNAGATFYVRELWSQAPGAAVLWLVGIAISGWAVLRQRDTGIVPVMRPLRPYLLFVILLGIGLTVSASKRELYLVWLEPFLALLAGCGWATVADRDQRDTRDPRDRKVGRLVLGVGMAVACFVSLYSGYRATNDASPNEKRIAVSELRDLDKKVEVMTLRMPTQVLAFYADRRVDAYTSEQSLMERLARGSDVRIIGKRLDLERLRFLEPGLIAVEEAGELRVVQASLPAN